MTRTIAASFAFFVLILTVSCSSAPGKFVRDPANQAQFDRDQAYCKSMGEKMRAQGKYGKTYNDCMLDKGYRTEASTTNRSSSQNL